MKRTGTMNPHLGKLIQELKTEAIQKKQNLWKRVASDLEKPTRQRRVVNISRIQRYAKDNETIIVPGKVLSSGEISKKVNVTALSFSDKAKQKIIKALFLMRILYWQNGSSQYLVMSFGLITGRGMLSSRIQTKM